MRITHRGSYLEGSVKVWGGEWYCTRHLPSLKMVFDPRFPEKGASCSIYKCPSSVEGEDVVKQIQVGRTHHTPSKKCSFVGCEKLRRERSKYCSRDCSNKNARARYRRRRSQPNL